MDLNIVKKIQTLAPEVIYKINNNGKCYYLDFTNKNEILTGIIRNSSRNKKEKIISLINQCQELEYLNLSKNHIGDFDLPSINKLKFLNIS